MRIERTLVIIKPDALQRQLAGRILTRFEDKGLRIAAMKLDRVDEGRARDLYSVHEGKEFYEPLVGFITAGPVVALVLEGLEAITVVRTLLGATRSFEAAPGTIRGDMALSPRLNLVHGSDSEESARREIPIFFTPDEIVDAGQDVARWLYGPEGTGAKPGDEI
jgi:nucleoside-diphosphate kinase